MLQTLIGVVFVVSAVLKIMGMDRFEIYIYSYHFFNLNFSFLVARATIILELILGIGLVANCFHRLMWWGSMSMMIGYTLLLIYALILGRTDSCHCFGDFLQLDPWQSLFKNIVLIALLVLVYRMRGCSFKGQWLALIGSVIVVSIAVFLISPPDNFLPDYNDTHVLQTEYFNQAISESSFDNVNLTYGKQIICFFSTSCKYCQMAAQKLSLMQEFYGFPSENITYVFLGTEEGVTKFYEKSGSASYRYVLYQDAVNLLKITNGNFPIMAFMENGKVVREYGFRNMNEAEIKAFMAS